MVKPAAAAAASLAPAGYTVAITRIPLDTSVGIYRLTGRKGESNFVVGTPVLNVVDGALSSVTVYPFTRKGNKRPVRIPRHRLSHLGLSENTSDEQRLTFAGLTR